MAKLWKGRFSKETDAVANDFNSSIAIDGRMFAEDIDGSVAHATMLGAVGVISQAEADSIVAGLLSIKTDLEAGGLTLSSEAEDIHSFVEQELTARIGEVGKKLHTGRSRNDQIALDTRLYLAKKIDKTADCVKCLLQAILVQAKNTKTLLVPAYTHLQRAQPIYFAQQLLAYSAMLRRDLERLADTKGRTLISPLGSAALAGTSYPIDRALTAKSLGMTGYTSNSIDGVSDRDFVVELASDLAILQMHLSRFAEELIIWCSSEFGFVELSDAFSTGSSIMPQKKNPDIAELVRGKTGRVYGNLVALLTVLKGLPLAYNKDMQEDKELIFDSVDTVCACLNVFAPMLETAVFNQKKMLAACENGFINATDAADYLVGKGAAFRDAYKIVGELVAFCIAKSVSLNKLPIEDYLKFSPLFSEDIYAAIDIAACAEKRNSVGGTSTASILTQIADLESYLSK